VSILCHIGWILVHFEMFWFHGLCLWLRVCVSVRGREREPERNRATESKGERERERERERLSEAYPGGLYEKGGSNYYSLFDLLSKVQ